MNTEDAPASGTGDLDPLLLACARLDVVAVTQPADDGTGDRLLLFQRRADADTFHDATSALDLGWDKAPWPLSMTPWSRSVTITAAGAAGVLDALQAARRRALATDTTEGSADGHA